MRQILTKLRDANLVVKLEKCKFYTQKVGFLEYIISLEKVKIELKKV